MALVALARLVPSNPGAVAEPEMKEPPWILWTIRKLWHLYVEYKPEENGKLA